MTTAGKTPELNPGLETFLESAGRGFLVTRRQDGSPTTHPLTPLWADGAIHFNTYRKSAKVRNLLRHPRVACVVTSADDDLPILPWSVAAPLMSWIWPISPIRFSASTTTAR